MIAQHPPPPSILVEQQMDSGVTSSIASPPPAHLHDTSDCGSSSGVGGMKDASAASDEASSSSEQTPAVNTATLNASELNGAVPSSSSASGNNNFDKRPASLPLSRYSIPPPVIPPSMYGGMPMMAPPLPPLPQASGNDLFVHIQVGETLSIHVGNEIQQITGPATVRMVGEAGLQALTIPLPLNVPKGHVVHQLCDEQGYLRHIILSPETARDAPQCNMSPAAIPSTSGAASPMPSYNPRPTSSSIPPLPLAAVPTAACTSLSHQQPPGFYTVNRQFQQHRGPTGGGRRGGGGNQQSQPDPLLAQANHVPQEQIEIDQEDVERIKTMLSRMTMLSVRCIKPTEADVTWMEVDTSEANSLAPFPQIDGSEFSYQLLVQECAAGRGGRRDRDIVVKVPSSHGARVMTDRSHARITKLQPNRDYTVQVQARLDERGILGDYSTPFHFKTPAALPDAPSGLKADLVDQTSCVLRWCVPGDGGSPLSHCSLYRVSANMNGDEEVEMFLETREYFAKVEGLRPGASYKFKVTATNRVGESAPSNVCAIFTRGETAALMPFIPTVIAVGARSAKVCWTSVPDWTYTVEQMDVVFQRSFILKSRGTGSLQYANDLNPGETYLFRVIAHAPDDGYVASEWLQYRHHAAQRNNARETVPLVLPTPAKPYVNKDAKRLEISWRTSKDVIYIIEGAAMISHWKQIYKGYGSTLTLTDEHAGLMFFRLMLQSKRSSATSDWSEPLRLQQPVKQTIYKIPALLTPTFSDITKHSMKITWTAAEYSAPVAGTTVLYELRRIDCVSQLLYSGPDPSFVVESLRPKQHVAVQVRIVAVDCLGKRREGEWSATGSAWTMRDAPHPPHSLALSQDRKELHWTVSEDVIGEAQFTVTRTTMGEEQGSEAQFETASPKLALTDLAPGVTYAFQVVAHCPWGESPASETFHMSTAAEVPLAPEPISVEARAQRELTVRWTAPEARGSALRAYHIRVEHDRQIIREAMTVASSSTTDELEYKVEDLEPDTVYRVTVAASNDVGTGPQAKSEGRTLRPPPPAPSLDGEGEPTQIRLKWRAVPSDGPSSEIRYRIYRLADVTDAYIPVYEGNYCSAKIKNLNENTAYRFQIRSYEKATGHGPWSKVYTFRTPFAPPPTIKVVPTATSIGNGSHTIEWPSVIPKGNPRGLFYRAQTHAASDKKDQWRTVYEGGVNSFTLKVPAESSLLTRVFVVRPDGGTGIISQPSPPLNVSSIGETKVEEEVIAEPVAPTLFERLRDTSGTARLIMTIILITVLWTLFWMVTSPSEPVTNSTLPLPEVSAPTVPTVPPTVPSPAPPPAAIPAAPTAAPNAAAAPGGRSDL